MLFDDDFIREQRRDIGAGDYVDPDPLPEDLEIPDGVLLSSGPRHLSVEFSGLLRDCDFGDPDEEAELLLRAANLLFLEDEDGEPVPCVFRTLDLFAVTNFVLVLLLRGVEPDNREEFFDFLDQALPEKFTDDVAPWFDGDDTQSTTESTDDERSA